MCDLRVARVGLVATLLASMFIGWRGRDLPAEPTTATSAQSPAPPVSPEGTLEAKLGGPDGPLVSAKYKVKTKGAAWSRVFEVEMKRATPGDVYAVTIDGVAVGSVTIGSKGKGELELTNDHESPPSSRFVEPRAGSLLGVGDRFEAPMHPRERLAHLEGRAGQDGRLSVEVSFKKDRLGKEIFREFKVEVRDGEPQRSYVVAIDGVPVGRLETSAKKEGELEYAFDAAPFPADFNEPRPDSVVGVGDVVVVLEQVGPPTSEPDAGLRSVAVTATPTVYRPAAWERIGAGVEPGNDAPRAGEDGAVAYDGVGHRLFYFGGKDDDQLNTNDLWTFELETRHWRPVVARGVLPPPREDHTLVLDEANRELILYGGEDGEASRETWSFDLQSGTWSQITHDSAPRRESHVAMYDAPRQRMVVFGGLDGSHDPCDDSWALDLNRGSRGYGTWRRLETGSPSPGARREHAAAPDPRHGRMFVYGGRRSASKSFLDDLWVLDLEHDRWSRIDTSGDAPLPIRQMALAYDPGMDELVVFGGEVRVEIDGEWERFSVDRVWVLDVANSMWSDRTPNPRARYDHIGVFVPEYGSTLIYGGSSYRAEKEHSTWLLGTRGRDTAAALPSEAADGSSGANDDR